MKTLEVFFTSGLYAANSSNGEKIVAIFALFALNLRSYLQNSMLINDRSSNGFFQEFDQITYENHVEISCQIVESCFRHSCYAANGQLKYIAKKKLVRNSFLSRPTRPHDEQ